MPQRTPACRRNRGRGRMHASTDCSCALYAGAVLNVNTFCPARGPSAIRQVQAANCRGAKAASNFYVRQVGHALLLTERTMPSSCFHNALDDLAEQPLQFVHVCGAEFRYAVLHAIDSIGYQAMQMELRLAAEPKH